MKRPTLADVARLAAVDRAVVSRVLSGDPALRVRDETRERVLDAVETLGYRRNALARGLRTSRAGSFGLVVPAYSNPVYAEVIQGAQDAAAERGASLVTVSLETLNFARQSPLDLLRDGRVDGLLVAGLIGQVSPRELSTFGPCLSVNRRIEGFDRWVVLDDEAAVRLAVEHLYALGHRRIAHLAGPSTADTAVRRAAGFRSAVADLTAADPADAIVQPGEFTSEGGYVAMRRLLEAAKPPTAVVVANLTAAVGALRAATDSGVQVPSELSFVALHDLPLAGFLVPGLTTVSMPLTELGRRAVEILAGTPPLEPVHEVIEAPIVLIERESTAPPGAVARPVAATSEPPRSRDEELR